MDTIVFNGARIPVMTVPKGTLLFRAVKHAESDSIGADVGKGTLCVPANYNVFFYTSPYVVDGIHWFDDGFPNVEAYVVPHDLTIVSLVKPSSLTRSSRKEKDKPIESCDVQKSCLKGREYDPCFKPAFLKEHPNIHGWMAIAGADAKEVLTAIRQRKLDGSTIQILEDARGIRGPPEIALYPLKVRSTEDVFVTHPQEWKAKHRGEYNYTSVATLKRGCDDRERFLREHARFDRATGFYMRI